MPASVQPVQFDILEINSTAARNFAPLIAQLEKATDSPVHRAD